MMLLWADQTAIRPDQFDNLAVRWLNASRKEQKPKTTTRRYTSLRTWATFAEWPAPMLEEYTLPTPARATPHPIPEGIDGVLAMAKVATNDRHRALVGLCGFAGLRVSEALSVRPADVDHHNRTLMVRGKGDRERVVPLSDKAYAAIMPAVVDAAALLRESVVGLSDRGARDALTNLAKKVGISIHVSSHDLRATFATAAYDKTLNLRAVQELLGHSNPATTQVYTRVSMTTMRDAADL